MSDLVLVPPPRSIRREKGEIAVDGDAAADISTWTIGSPLPEGVSFSAGPLAEGDHPDGHNRYRLTISGKGIEIEGAGPGELFSAIQTLRQILMQCDGSVPCCTIDDWADYPVRGVMLDISRDRVPTMETLFGLIDMWALLKLNQLQLYMEHTFAYPGHEKVWKDASPITPGEIRQLDRYCAQRGIELVPNQNSFGHMERWLMHEEYQHLAEMPGGFTDPWGVFRPASSTLAPSAPGTLAFLGELYDQLLPCFSSSFFNIGGDEPWELGQGRSAAACKRLGLERVYVDFLLELHGLVRSRGKRMMVWADILMKYPAMVDELPEDIILMEWGYEGDHPFESECERLASVKNDYYLCTGTSAWNTLGGRWPNTVENIGRAARIGLENGAGGFYITEWGDNGHLQQHPVPMPGYFYAAAAAWNVEGADSFDMTRALSRFAFGSADESAAGALMLLEELGGVSGIKMHNASLPWAVLTDHLAPYYRDAVETAAAAGYNFSGEEALLDRADLLLDEAEAAEAAPEEIIEELRFTSAIIRFACRLGREKDNPGARSGLRETLLCLIAEYRRIWNKRSRPGGLNESAGRLEALADKLKG